MSDHKRFGEYFPTSLSRFLPEGVRNAEPDQVGTRSLLILLSCVAVIVIVGVIAVKLL